MSNCTFTQFLQEEQRKNNNADCEFILLLNDIASACKHISSAVCKGALAGTMGSLETENVQGETQKHLDVITNDIFLQANQSAGYFSGMASEEMEEPYTIPAEYRQHGKYLLLFDPLDGSSNVNVNISVGTIFSVLGCPEGAINPKVEDFLQPGTQQVCAGYALYGSSTMLVITIGHGVNGFTLDNEIGDFLLTHANMQVPANTSEFAINMSNQKLWEAPVQRYIEECLQGAEGPRGKAFNMRWVASMVAEVHRILIRGGIFMYPIDSKIKQQGGKLRLMYEANPMSFIVEQAGGLSTTGYERIMELQPAKLHQRVPVLLGSKNEVELITRYHREATN